MRSLRTLRTLASLAFEPSSKRRRGYPSETAVKRGHRLVHGNKELYEKLGNNDLCPCGSGRRFQAVLPQ
ncbi:MAG: SEC-C metal-binding domain-containing protein [Cyanobacteria bacterium J06639_16]